MCLAFKGCLLRPSSATLTPDQQSTASQAVLTRATPDTQICVEIPNLTHSFFVFSSSSRNSVPQSPNFPVANASAHETVLQRVTEMFKLNFPYTTVYPALGNLDVLHPWILERESSSAAASSREAADHYRSTSRGHKKRRKWLQQDHHYTARCESPMTSASDKFSL